MKEKEIRPRELFEAYLCLCRQDAEALDKNKFQAVGCPGCGHCRYERQFVKHGFDYVRCNECGTLFCSPRPKESELDRFYTESDSARFWSETFFPAVSAIRRERLFSKKAEQVAELVDCGDIAPPRTICDVGAGDGAFIDALKRLFPGVRFSAIEPNRRQARRCRESGVEVLEKSAENAGEWAGRFDLVICTEVIEHVHSTDRFVDSLFRLCSTGGACIVTGLGYEGFDILTQQKESNSVFPPHHLNFLSIEGFKHLFRRMGFETVITWTPGELDVDIVANCPPENEFVRVLLSRGSETLRAFQEFLKKHKLSSHVWVLAQKGTSSG